MKATTSPVRHLIARAKPEDGRDAENNAVPPNVGSGGATPGRAVSRSTGPSAPTATHDAMEQSTTPSGPSLAGDAASTARVVPSNGGVHDVSERPQPAETWPAAVNGQSFIEVFAPDMARRISAARGLVASGTAHPASAQGTEENTAAYVNRTMEAGGFAAIEPYLAQNQGALVDIHGDSVHVVALIADEIVRNGIAPRDFLDTLTGGLDNSTPRTTGNAGRRSPIDHVVRPFAERILRDVGELRAGAQYTLPTSVGDTSPRQVAGGELVAHFAALFSEDSLGLPRFNHARAAEIRAPFDGLARFLAEQGTDRSRQHHSKPNAVQTHLVCLLLERVTAMHSRGVTPQEISATVDQAEAVIRNAPAALFAAEGALANASTFRDQLARAMFEGLVGSSRTPNEIVELLSAATTTDLFHSMSANGRMRPLPYGYLGGPGSDHFGSYPTHPDVALSYFHALGNKDATPTQAMELAQLAAYATRRELRDVVSVDERHVIERKGNHADLDRTVYNPPSAEVMHNPVEVRRLAGARAAEHCISAAFHQGFYTRIDERAALHFTESQVAILATQSLEVLRELAGGTHDNLHRAAALAVPEHRDAILERFANDTWRVRADQGYTAVARERSIVHFATQLRDLLVSIVEAPASDDRWAQYAAQQSQAEAAIRRVLTAHPSFQPHQAVAQLLAQRLVDLARVANGNQANVTAAVTEFCASVSRSLSNGRDFALRNVQPAARTIAGDTSPLWASMYDGFSAFSSV